MPGKLKSKWIGPYKIIGIRANGAVEIQGVNANYVPFLVNGRRVKVFRDSTELCEVEEIPLHKFPLLPKKSCLNILREFLGQVDRIKIFNQLTKPASSQEYLNTKV